MERQLEILAKLCKYLIRNFYSINLYSKDILLKYGKYMHKASHSAKQETTQYPSMGLYKMSV